MSKSQQSFINHFYKSSFEVNIKQLIENAKYSIGDQVQFQIKSVNGPFFWDFHIGTVIGFTFDSTTQTILYSIETPNGTFHNISENSFD